MRLLTAGLVVLLLLLQYRLWLGNGSLPKVQQLEQIKSSQQEENKLLEERNRSLSAEVIDLKQGMEAIEERARSEMGMIKSGETFFQIVDREDSGPAGQVDK